MFSVQSVYSSKGCATSTLVVIVYVVFLVVVVGGSSRLPACILGDAVG